jgi:hypothetical protein
VAIELDSIVPLRGEDGRSLELMHTQGGAFSKSGRRLYVTAGYLGGFCNPSVSLSDDALRERGGIHVVDTTSWQRIAKSDNGPGRFSYPFDPTLPACDEPEGVAVWSFDAHGHAPRAGLEGELHVLTLSNGLLADRVSIHHYTGRLHVRGGAAEGGNGTARAPFARLVDALAAAWPGARIVWERGPDDGDLDLPFTLPVAGGRVRVNSPQPTSPEVSAEAPDRPSQRAH